MKKLNILLASLLALLFAGAASAEPSGLDVSAVTAYFTGDITDAVQAVGIVILTLAAVSVGFKWLKGMIFG